MLVLAASTPVVGNAVASTASQEPDQCVRVDTDYSSDGYEQTALDTLVDPTTGGPPPVDDPLYPLQWHLPAIGAPDAWSRGARGQNQRIAFVETGVDVHHPDLREKIVAGRLFYEGTGLTTTCSGFNDENGHGTIDAGIAAAVTNNGQGVAGVAPLAELIIARTPDAAPSTPSGRAALSKQVAEAIRWAADQGADVINLSLGGPRERWERVDGAAAAEQPGPVIAEAVAYAEAAGAVVVAAAMNVHAESWAAQGPTCMHPADLPTVICVAGVDRRGLPVAHSNAPLKATGVSVRAPGSSQSAPPPQARPCHGAKGVGRVYTAETLWTTMNPDATRGLCMPVKGYGPASGSTSQSTPVVSGVAALLTGRNLAPADVRACLALTSSSRGSYDPVLGYGRVDAAAAVRECRPGLARRVGDPAREGWTAPTAR